jgi:hypothetical protein
MTRNAIQWAERPRLPEDHFVSSRVYVDPDLFSEEWEKIPLCQTTVRQLHHAN